MSVEQVRALQEVSASAPPVAIKADEEARGLRYDPAFRGAVKDGFLSQQQALERGKREVWAEKLVLTHHLTIESAREVADNRVSLLEAIRRHTADLRGPVELIPPRTPTRSWATGLLVVALLAVIGVTLASLFARSPEDQDLASRQDQVDVQRVDGRIVRIEGPDPDSVLKAYCESNTMDRATEVVGIVKADRETDLQMGILRDLSAPVDRLAIYISHNRYSRRWIAGNGRSPLVAFQAPTGAGD